MQNRKFNTVVAQASLSSLSKHIISANDDQNAYGMQGSKSCAGIHAADRHIPSVEEIIDDIMEHVQDESPNVVIESVLKTVFDASQAILWVYLPNINSIYSASFSVTVPAQPSLLLTGLRSRVPLAVPNQGQSKIFTLAIDTKILPPNAPILTIPIMTRDMQPLACVQFTRRTDCPFTPNEITLASQITKKFADYSSFIFTDQSSMHAAFKAVAIESLQTAITSVCSSISKTMRCRHTELWLYRRKKGILMRFDQSAPAEVIIAPAKSGIAGRVLMTGTSISERNVCDSPYYNPASDGFYSEAFIGVPFVEKTTRVWCVVCRGRISPPYFTPNDLAKLTAITPFAVKSISSAVLPKKVDSKTQSFQAHLSALLEVAEALSGVLVIDQLIPLIMSKSVELLKCERCSLFLVDVVKKELKTFFHGGLSNAIRIPIGSGIAGTTATTGEIINITDAYSDKRFDSSVDAKTGFKTKSILSTPIYNNRGEIIGVTEMINKENGECFDEDDINLLNGFDVFCGISLDNAKLYEASLSLAKQVRSFVDLSSALNQSTALRNVLTEILTNAVTAVNGTGATLYRADKEDKVIELCHVGQPSKYGYIFADEVVKKKEQHIYSTDEMAQKLQSLNLQDAVNEMLSSNKDLNTNAPSSKSVVSLGFGKDNIISEQLCCLPLFNSEGEVIGVLLINSVQKIMSEDISLLDCFAIFAAVSLERSELKDVAKLGTTELELKEWIDDNERDVYDAIPQKLALSVEDKAKLWTVKFDAPQWQGMPFFKAIFAIFDRFQLQQTYKITNEKLFRFLCEIRDTYNKVPYHNWRHAVDVTQFMTYELILSGAEKMLSSLELLTMVVAALCHDANHDGFTNVFNVKAETPLGILFKNQSVMETHHCEVAIGIISKEETNLFSELKPGEFKFAWTTVIQLILATDMAKHFNFLKEFKELNESKQWDPVHNHAHRLMLMQLVLKTADISNVSRPFELADRWCDVLCEEFFRQGDLEMASGMEYTSDLNDREHLDKPKSQIGFYTFVCLPLYQVVAQALPPLEANVKQVQSNLAQWKAAAEKKAKEEQEAK